MPSFAITPAGPFNPGSQGDFPDYIQFQANGVNLGEPTATTVDFSTGLTATRGDGESANKITVTAAGGGGGGAQACVMRLNANSIALSDGTTYTDWQDGTPIVESPDVYWDTSSHMLTAITEGMYEIVVHMGMQNLGGSDFPNGVNQYGTITDSSITDDTYYFMSRQDGQTDGTSTWSWTDTFINNKGAGGGFFIGARLKNVEHQTFEVVFEAVVLVRRIGPYIPPT